MEAATLKSKIFSQYGEPFRSEETNDAFFYLFKNELVFQELKNVQVAMKEIIEDLAVCKKFSKSLAKRMVMISDSSRILGTDIEAAMKYMDESPKYIRRTLCFYKKGVSMNSFISGVLAVIRRIPKYKQIMFLSSNLDKTVKEIEETLIFDYSESLWKKLKKPEKDCPLLWHYSINGIEGSWIKIAEDMGQSDTAVKNRWKAIPEDIKSENPQIVFSLLREWHFANKPMNIDFIDFSEREVMQGKPLSDNGNEV